MLLSDSLLNQIDKGREGRNWGLPMGMPKLEYYIDGVSQETYTVIFSGSGVGKTSFTLYSYIYRPIMANLETPDKFQILYISLEMKPEILLAKLLSTYILETYGVEISYKRMLSKTRNEVLSDQEYDLIKKSKEWLEKVEKMITIYDKSLNAVNYFKLLKDLADSNGSFLEDDKRTYYTPNDPDKVILVVVDHIALATPTQGNTLKNEMDKISSVAVQFRNKCKFSFVHIMQANRDSSNVERRKMDLIYPQRNDIKDSSCMEADSDLIIALFNPFREHMKKCRGNYDITILQRYFREISILKSRYGDGDIAIGCVFFGGSNYWHELPKGDDIYDYEPLTKIETYIKPQLNKNESKDENKEIIDNEKDQDTKQPFEFIL